MAESEPRYPYEDQQLSTEQRVEDLLARLDLDDKIGLLFHSHAMIGNPENPDQYGRTATAELIRNRRITAFLLQGGPSSPREIAQWHNEVQNIALEHPLGIPVTFSSDPRHGVSDNPLSANESGIFSRWPEPLGIAATADPEIARQFGDITRREYLASGIRVALHPQIDLTTEPRWARALHTFGESSELTSSLVTAYLEGLQAGNGIGQESVSGMAKHFPGGGPQKDGLDPHFKDGREQVYPGGMFEEHLAPFKAAIAAGVSQMMPYYGMPVGLDLEEVGFAFNRQVITGILREQLGFDGIVCTDFGVITGYGEGFPAKAWGVEHLTPEERIAKSLNAGVDQFGGENNTQLLASAVRNGLVTEKRLDESVRRILREKFVLGQFDQRRFVDPEVAVESIGVPVHIAAGVAAQKASLVYLSENPSLALPLKPGISVYAEGVEPAAFDGLATVVESPAQADVIIVRTSAPSYTDPTRGFLGSMHKGSLEYQPEFLEHIEELAGFAPVLLDVFLDRPAVLSPLVEKVALVGSFGVDDIPFLEVLFGDSLPAGRLPFDLPRSQAAVEASREDVPFDTENPLFRFGHGLGARVLSV